MSQSDGQENVKQITIQSAITKDVNSKNILLSIGSDAILALSEFLKRQHILIDSLDISIQGKSHHFSLDELAAGMKREAHQTTEVLTGNQSHQDDPFADVCNKRMSEISPEQQDLATEFWLRKNKLHLSKDMQENIEALFRTLDKMRASHSETGSATQFRSRQQNDTEASARISSQHLRSAAGRPTSTHTYDARQIASHLHQTAMGYAHHGNALRVAKDFDFLTAEDRAVLDRYATGAQSGTDHIGLQDIALRVRSSQEQAQKAAPSIESLTKELQEAQDSLDYYRHRYDQLQSAQSMMRDPERTLVCDILANGQLLKDANGNISASRYKSEEKRSLLEQYDLEQSDEYRAGYDAGRVKGFNVGYRFAAEELAAQNSPSQTTSQIDNVKSADEQEDKPHPVIKERP